MNDQIDSLRSRAAAMSSTFVEMVQSAYDAGFRDGGLAMRDHILQAANAPVAIKAGSVSATTATGAATSALNAATAARNLERPVWETYATRPTATTFVTDTPHTKRIASRAPRGLVRRAVEEALTAEPGLSIVEIEERVVGKHPEIAKKSVGNQLRHFENDLYRREGKYNWFLMGEPQKETARPALPADLADLLGPVKGGEAQ